MIRIEHLRKEYELSCPLKDVNVTINKGDIICVIGPSGTGKSTFLRMINLLEKPTSGKIFFNNEEITTKYYKPENARKKMSMVFQSFNLFNHLSVIENLVTPQIDLLNIDYDTAYTNAMQLLKKVNMDRQYLSYPSSLSGGQKQRVAIARALVMKPEIILFDEPTSALDPIMVKEIQNIIKDLAKNGQTMMIVTHDMNFAEEVGNRIFYMDQGGIYEDGTPNQIFHHPLRTRTKAFIENLNVLKLVVHDNFDYDQYRNTINTFVDNYKIPNHVANDLTYIADELLYGLLINKLDIKDVRLLISCDLKKNKLFINCKYSGNKQDVLKLKNDNVKRLKKNISKTKFSSIQEEKYTNCITFETK